MPGARSASSSCPEWVGRNEAVECSASFSVAVRPTWVILPGEVHGQRRESYTAERLTQTQTHGHTHKHTHTSQLHNYPSPTPMAFCTQSVNPGALPSWEATRLGSRRPVCTCPRLLSCNYGFYLPAQPEPTPGFSHPVGRARTA